VAPRVLIDATDVPADRGALGRYVDGLIGALDVAGADLAVVCQRADEERYGRLAPSARILTGPTALTFVRGDVASAAKAVADYGRATQLLPFKGGLMGGAELDVEQIRSLSRLPSRDVLYGQLVGVVASPVSGLVRTLNALISGIEID